LSKNIVKSFDIGLITAISCFYIAEIKGLQGKLSHISPNSKSLAWLRLAETSTYSA
jgi:hypothetical protein